NMSLAQLGYSGVNGGFSQNQQMPPVQYGAPNMPVYNPPMPAQQFQPTLQGFQQPAMQNMQMNAWGALPPPSYAQQPIMMNQYQPSMAQMPQMQQVQPIQQIQYQPQNTLPVVMPQPQIMPQPTQMQAQFQQPAQQIQQVQPVISETPAFATPNVIPQNNTQVQQTLGLSAPTYVTPITNTPVANNFMPQPLQPQLQPENAPIQQVNLQQAPITNIQQDNNSANQPQQSVNQQQNIDIDEFLEPLSNNTQETNLKTAESENNLNIPLEAQTMLQANGSNVAVPVENISQQDVVNTIAKNAEPEVEDILKNPARSAYTPASGIIDTMQQRGNAANIANLSNSANSLNTPLDFDQYGNPVLPASFNKTVSLKPQQGLYNYQAPTSQPASMNNNNLNSLQQRVNEMRL
ncbi:MAG: hypothetical protein SFT90_00395, partial [Rickettsiales bacterium]|nr:hypothetical protein [Rickettsiales bacterium]